ncbi:hypothetical protein, partial [Streptomyces sp.]|uniref:hypothetical protein n=1 Tax=Streptomyces sp. TaxID=1931 RepID=UPI002812004B
MVTGAQQGAFVDGDRVEAQGAGEFVDGDPFSDFATLVRTSLVLRDGIAHHQTDLTTTHAPVVDPTR